MKLTREMLDAAMLKKSPGFFIVDKPMDAIEYLKRDHPKLVSNEYDPEPNSEKESNAAVEAAERRKVLFQTANKVRRRIAQRVLETASKKVKPCQ